MTLNNYTTVKQLQRYSTNSRDFVTHHTSNKTLRYSQTGSVHSNSGAAGAVTLTLPQNAEAGVKFKFVVITGQTLNVDPGSAGAFYANGAKLSDDTDLSSSEIGESIEVTCVGNNDWAITGINGQWGLSEVVGTQDLNGGELILDADGDTSITADTDDQIDIRVSGADDFVITANTFTASTGSIFAGEVFSFNGATGANEIRLVTNLADALSIEDTAGDLIVIDTTTGTQVITVTPATTVTGVLTANGGITTGGTVTLSDGALVAVLGAGTGTGDVVQRIGASATEGVELRVYEETISPSAVETNAINIPANSRIISVQSNVETALTGGGTTVTYSIGTAGDPDKYGTPSSDSLTQNTKTDFLGDGTTLTSSEQMVLTGTATGGAADGDTALTVGSVRIRVVYETLNSLDNA